MSTNKFHSVPLNRTPKGFVIVHEVLYGMHRQNHKKEDIRKRTLERNLGMTSGCMRVACGSHGHICFVDKPPTFSS